MTSTFIQRVLGRARGAPAALGTTARAALALATLATMLAPAAQPPVSAAQRFVTESRLHVVVKEVKIHDDRDGLFAGQGEMEMLVRIGRCPVELPAPCAFNTVVGGPQAQAKITKIRANSGETVALDRMVPQEGDETDGHVPPEMGFNTWPGYYTVVRFDMMEYDDVSNPENMGSLVHVLEAGKHDEHLGTFTARSLSDEGTKVGDFTVTFQVRRAPTPDLRAEAIRMEAVPGSPRQRLCARAVNNGTVPAGPFSIDFYVDGIRPSFGVAESPGLVTADRAEYCIEVDPLPAGPHMLGADVDARGKVVEFNEANNLYEQSYTVVASVAPNDLIIGAIKVNGQVPDGKDDCKDGKNDVVVVVKNAGTADVGAFTVQLVVDDATDAARKQSVSGLAAGQQQEVHFEDVRLKKGERTLTAHAAAASTVATSEADTGEAKVVTRCKEVQAR